MGEWSGVKQLRDALVRDSEDEAHISQRESLTGQDVRSLAEALARGSGQLLGTLAVITCTRQSAGDRVAEDGNNLDFDVGLIQIGHERDRLPLMLGGLIEASDLG